MQTFPKKALTVSGITASNKQYDGNNSATVDVSGASFGGIVAGDDREASRPQPVRLRQRRLRWKDRQFVRDDGG